MDPQRYHPLIMMISDLHLTPSRPDITALFLAFVRNEAPDADALYILGDLFETWIGDDDDSDLNSQVAAALSQLSQTGTRVYFIGGNRDFLLGNRFAGQCNMQLLPDVCVHKLFGVPTLLMHGDTLCTDDTGYQQFRIKRNHWWWRAWRTRLPLWLRRKIADDYRKRSDQAKAQKQMDIMDVNAGEVQRVMQQYDVPRLIHGHTHRPAVHDLKQGHQRIVLGDWYEQGSILVLTPDSTELQSRKFLAEPA